MYTLNVGAQLHDLRELQDGWLDGAGNAPSRKGLEWLHHAFECNYPDQVPVPHIYPTESGGVQAEWSIGSNEITLNVDLETHLGEWHLLNMESGHVYACMLNCDDDGVWRWLVDRIKALAVCDGDLRFRSCCGNAEPD